ncbi:thiamine pyrophosphokinase 1-like [Tachypleus tridentatus]|uniref:thiamine pyrophosphokinase 1-like n=1 Tax=Tachypleus tridentatus TaxID=6853 RepID=UPI003FD5D636
MSSSCVGSFVAKEWKPLELLSGNSGNKYVIILLNQPFDKQEKLKVLWKNAVLRVAVDGGTKHLYNLTEDHMANCIPHLITGDFDSLDFSLQEFYRKKGSQIIHTFDQDETDFTKSIRESIKFLEQKNISADSFLIVCRNGGRMDHVLSNLNTLYLAKDITCLPVFLFSGYSILWLLDEGQHKIHVPTSVHHLHCGLIPLGEPCQRVTTTGLKWNLRNDRLNFGGLISTSNTYSGLEVVTVKNRKETLVDYGH